MNKKAIGKFIEEQRKEKGLTQAHLASKLFISEQMVSNWENGKKLPEQNVIPLLCKALDISVCELLSAKRLEDDYGYKSSAEEHLLELVSTKKKARIGGLMSAICLSFLFLVSFVMCFIAEYAELSYELELVIGISATVLMVLCSFGFVVVFHSYTSYECPNCRHVFTPTLKQEFFALHMANTKKLKCPKCNTVSYCKLRVKNKK